MTAADRRTKPDPGAGRAGRRLVFFLSPRVIDFDTYLPTALAIKRARPEHDIRFVTFSRENYEFIHRNPTLVRALGETGSLHLLGSEDASTPAARFLRKVSTLLTVSGWILGRRRPALFLGVPFAVMPYALWYLLAKLRGGHGFMLWKVRSSDVSQEMVRAVRKAPPAPVRASPLLGLLGRHCDALVHYHGDQERNISWAASYGRFDDAPRLRIGMPHLNAPWRELIAAETERAREDLVRDGVPPDAEYYCFFPAKVLSSETLREAGSIERGFVRAAKAIARMRPKAVLLIRPHPLAQDEPYVLDLIDEVGPARARTTFLHPEVLISMSRRAIFNNPTNIMFSCFPGRMIDVSDYAEQQYERFGEVSLAHGYGPVFVNPRSADFEARLGALLEDDAEFDRPENIERARELLDRWPASIDTLLDWLDAPARMPRARRLETPSATADHGV